jgi:hypothetical protein
MGVKWPVCEANHSPSSSAEVKEWVELYLHSPNMPSWRGTQLKHRDTFTFHSPNGNLQINHLYCSSIFLNIFLNLLSMPCMRTCLLN